MQKARLFAGALVMALEFTSLVASANAQAKPPATTQKPAAPATQARPPANAPAAKAAEVAVPTDFVIGPEDVLGVVFWRETEISGDYTVRPDGMITLPLIGDTKASGLRPEALKEIISKSAGKYLNEVNVTVVVRQMNSRKVFITGNVANPGPYPLTGPRTVMQLISEAGGLTEYAKQGDIRIIREQANTTRSFKFNYKDVSKGKNLQQNIQLLPLDTVVVP